MIMVGHVVPEGRAGGAGGAPPRRRAASSLSIATNAAVSSAA